MMVHCSYSRELCPKGFPNTGVYLTPENMFWSRELHKWNNNLHAISPSSFLLPFCLFVTIVFLTEGPHLLQMVESLPFLDSIYPNILFG